MEEEVKSIEVSKIIEGVDFKKAFEYVKDVEKYHEIMPNVQKVTIEKEENGKRITFWDTLVEGVPLRWREEDFIDEEGGKIEFNCIWGDLEIFRGYWMVKEKTFVELKCYVEFKVGIPEISEMITPLLQDIIRENLDIMLEHLKEKMVGKNA